jgi:hypothetical protein
MDERTPSSIERDLDEGRFDDLPAVAPAVAALTLAAAGLTFLAGYWLLRASRRHGSAKRSAFPTPAVHRSA